MTKGNAFENIWLGNVVFSSKCVAFQRALWEMWLRLFDFRRIRCKMFILRCLISDFRKHVKEPKKKHWNIKELSGLIKYMQPYVNIMHQYDLFHWSQTHINVWISAQSKWSSKWAKHKKWDKNGERRFWASDEKTQLET